MNSSPPNTYLLPINGDYAGSLLSSARILTGALSQTPQAAAIADDQIDVQSMIKHKMVAINVQEQFKLLKQKNVEEINKNKVDMFKTEL